MMGPARRVRRVLSVAAFVALAGCAVTDPTEYYTLGQPTVNAVEGRASGATSQSGVAQSDIRGIGVGPIIIPAYLDRTQIVTRSGADQVDLSTFHRWAEPLPDGIARILAEEIGARVPTDRIVMFPWRGVVAQTIQYQVVVGVMRFDGRPGGNITLDTRWRILATNGDELAFKRSTLVEAAAGSGYQPMVAAMTRAVLTLGQEIALRSVRCRDDASAP
jgi:hypothetical protein